MQTLLMTIVICSTIIAVCIINKGGGKDDSSNGN